MKPTTHMVKCLMAVLMPGVALWASIALEAAELPKGRAASPESITDGFYALEHLVEVEITLEPADWRALRSQHRNLVSGSARERSSDVYTYFKGDIRIDGQELRSVGIRKKGLLGSVVSTRPSLRISFDQFIKGQRFAGRSGLTLNNNNQDPSQICQFFTYRLFRAAGQPAPQCNFARVRVNGENLGIFSNVEPLNQRFLKREFGSAAGALFEGGGDFLPEAVGGFESKNNAAETRRADLLRVVQVLQKSSSNLGPTIDQAIDLEAFLTYWALEVLVGHWDSYSGNANNFAIYHHPGDGRFRFIPWGADDVFRDPGPFMTAAVPHSVKANSALTRRLYADPEVQARYRARMQQLLDSVWNEAKLLAWIDQAVHVIRGGVLLEARAVEESLERNRQFIRARRGQIESELRSPAPPWPHQAKARQNRPKGIIKADFSTTWSERLTPKTPGSGKLTMDLQLDGRQVPLTGLMPRAGLDAKSVRPDHPLIELAGFDAARNRYLVAWLAIDPLAFEQKRSVAIDFFNVFGALVEVAPEADLAENVLADESRVLGWLIGGLHLDQANRTFGGAIAGRLEAQVFPTQ